MTDKEDLRLDIVSSISEEFVDEVTRERIEAKKRAKKRRRLTAGVSMAASLLLLCSVLLPVLLLGLGGAVPTYTGMTVSNASPFDKEGGEVAYAMPCPFSYDSLTLSLERNGPPTKKPIEEGLAEHFAVSPGRDLYYAKPGESIYITVTFDNPDNYEILSFTLNGEKYTSYMFEEGSDMENIVLKVDVGDKSGLIHYTIDAIKYIDGDKIKNVRIGGERTVSVGVCHEAQPTASLPELSVFADRLRVRTAVTDPEGIIAAVEGEVYALIYDGTRVVFSQRIEVGAETAIEVETLTAGASYHYATVAVFDAYDGKGRIPHILCEKSFTFTPSVSIRELTVEGGRLTFSAEKANEEIRLLGVRAKGWDGATVFESDAAVTEIAEMPAGRLTLEVTYTYETGAGPVTAVAEGTVWNAEGMMPILGRIHTHYTSGIVSLPGVGLGTHCATDLVPISDDLTVYAIRGGVVEAASATVLTDQGTHYGMVIIRDDDGCYHLYKSFSKVSVKVGQRVAVGDALGEMQGPHPHIDGVHLHYECYTLTGDVKNYAIPSFDDAPRLESEAERIERIYRSNALLSSGMTFQMGDNATVTYTTDFETAYEDERVILVPGSYGGCVTVTARADGNYDITVDFSDVTVEKTVTVGAYIRVAGVVHTIGSGYVSLTVSPKDAEDLST